MPNPYLDEMIEEYKPVIAHLAYGDSTLSDFFPDDVHYGSESTIHPPLLQKQQNALYITNSLVNQYGQHPLEFLSFENATPTTQSDLLVIIENHLQELIFQIKRSFFISHSSVIANKLMSLYNYAKEEDPDSIGISTTSLQSYINFLHSNPNLKCPSISLTPDYNIYISWRAENKKVFSINFLPNGDARFVLFKPNEKHPNRMIRISGIVTIDVLIGTISHYQVIEWIG